jgi:hypothetical protein
MKAACPHCFQDFGLELNRLGQEWNLIRCFHCGEFSMIQTRSGLSHAEAIQKPKVVPARRRKSLATPPPFRHVPVIENALREFAEPVEAAAQAEEDFLIQIPEPLPELASIKKGFGPFWIPFLSATLATLIIALGFKVVRLKDTLRTAQSKTQWASPASFEPNGSRRTLKTFESQVQSPSLENIRAQAIKPSIR